MQIRSVNIPLQLIVLAIPLTSALSINLPISNGALNRTTSQAHANSSSTLNITTLPVSVTPSPDANVDEIVEDVVPGIVNGTSTAVSPSDLQAGDISIKKGGGGAGSRGSNTFGSGSSGGTRGSQRGSADKGGSSSGSSSKTGSSSNRGAARKDIPPLWIPLGGGPVGAPSLASAIGGPIIVARTTALACAIVLVVNSIF
ncbi:hypothetical protein F5Y12DRAFT_105140 [Xylaria sp. FL1777]|nr:hypothetical protein F5Y12DRAFT_105140 [Xylaria sp. FL1777]